VLVAISKGMCAAVLWSNKIVQFLTAVASQVTQVDVYSGHITVMCVLHIAVV